MTSAVRGPFIYVGIPNDAWYYRCMVLHTGMNDTLAIQKTAPYESEEASTYHIILYNLQDN
jgi:hypothetical protein